MLSTSGGSGRGGEEEAPPRSRHIYLLDCLTPSSLLASSAQATGSLLNTLHGVYHRVLAYPGMEKYRRINRDSPTWQSKVVPYVLHMRLAEWGGFLLVDKSSNAADEAGVRGEDDKGGRGRGSGRCTATTELVCTLTEAEAALRLFEVDLVRRCLTAQPTATPTSTPTTREATVALQSEAECQRLLTELALSVPGAAEWEGVRRFLYLGLLHAALLRAMEEGERMEGKDAAATWRGDAEVLLSRLGETLTAGRGESAAAAPSALALSLSSSSPSRSSDASSSSACLRSVLDFFRKADTARLTITTLSDCLALVDAQRQRGGPLCAQTHAASLSPEERRALRDAVAARYQQQHRAEALQHYRESTGEAYRQLTAEEQGAGITTILDIASAMEQVAILEETRGLVNPSKREANRLHEKFKQDGDLVYLQAVADEWEEKLEEVKRRTGKLTVFL